MDLDDRSLRNSIIQEQERETDEIIRTKVIHDLFRDRLGVDIHSVERVHRLDAKKPQKARPVIMKVYDCNETSERI